MKKGIKFLSYIVLASLLSSVVQFAQAEDKVIFSTNWRAQAGHGGFYQALVDGTYKKYGLDVEILQGGPQVNNRPMLPAKKIDFLMSGNMLQLFDNAKQRIPTVAVAAIFQKDPQAIIAHPGQNFDTWDDLKNAKKILIGKDGQFSFWQWMKTLGFKDEQLRPYNYSLSQFLADKGTLQQGYGISEPISVKKEAGFDPVVHLLADNGWSTYSTLIETRQELVDDNPELVQKFVDASIIGWYNYLYGDRAAADAEIIATNPDIPQEYLDQSVELMKSLGVVNSGDTEELGIGAMTDERMKSFHQLVIDAGLATAEDFDLASTYTTQFVNKGVGLDIHKALMK